MRLRVCTPVKMAALDAKKSEVNRGEKGESERERQTEIESSK